MRSIFRNIIVSASMLLITFPAVHGEDIQGAEFKAANGRFEFNGSPFLIKAAELHYPRIPREYWEHRIQMAKSLGMNTICLYVFWNVHEQEPGVFDFSGNNDLREFIKLCEANGMKVILRPGPYVCAEWEMGGLPWWLLKEKDIRLRENDPYFLERVKLFEEAVASQVSDLTVDKGGPIIMIQVENEYGAYGEDKEYISKIKDILRSQYGDDVLMFQCDWSSNFKLNGLDDLLWTINFGTGADIDEQFAELREARPESPLMCSEFWSGWFDKWGAGHETRVAHDMTAGIDEMLSKGISFSLYMTHGGTNWGHWAGANSPGYSPDVTSYDYDAPIDESGRPTEKYLLLREVMKKYLTPGDTLPSPPELPAPIAISGFKVEEVAPLWNNLPEALHDTDIRPMEYYGMGYGSILYSTILPAVLEGTVLSINDPHDYAQIFIGGEFVGSLDRRNSEKELMLKEFPEGSRLDILVEGMGRINFGRAIKDYKGITDSVTLSVPDGKPEPLSNWEITLLPDMFEFYDGLAFEKLDSDMKSEGRYPRGVYRGTFEVETPGDTYLNFETWGKGLVYVNGKGLGRIWEIGPQQTLFTPGPWLREGENEILVFDILGPSKPEVEGVEYPILDRLKLNESSAADFPNRSEFELVTTAEIKDGPGWKNFEFEEPAKSRYLLLEAVETYDDATLPAVAELNLRDMEGKRLSREKWQVAAGSENLEGGNHGADKVIDLQESTYWQPKSNDPSTHYLIIDLGEETGISSLEYLPRMEPGTPGLIKRLRISSM